MWGGGQGLSHRLAGRALVTVKGELVTVRKGAHYSLKSSTPSRPAAGMVQERSGPAGP